MDQQNPKKKNLFSSEHTLQLECIAWFRNEYERHGKGCIIPVVNELSYKKKHVVIKDGASDLIIVIPNKVLFIELKVGYNNQQINQIKFQKLIESLGYEYHIVRSLEQFKNLLTI